jgi:nickel/cobalt transporter (NiCoT) family protein
LLSDKLELSGQPWDFIAGIDINSAGRVIVAVFLLVWIGAVAYYKLARVDERYASAVRHSDRLDPAG